MWTRGQFGEKKLAWTIPRESGQFPSPMPDHNTLSHTALMRSATIAGWFTLHVLAAAELSRVAYGTFDARSVPPGKFVSADLAQVLAQLSIALHPAIAFGLLFLALAGAIHGVGLGWCWLLRKMNAEPLERLASSALRWSMQRQFTSAWLLLPLALGGTAWLAVVRGYSTAAVAIVALSIYAAPLLILRPRWLDAQNPDRSWLPGGAALGIYLVLTVCGLAMNVSAEWLGWWTVSLAVFAVDLILGMIQDSVLVHTRARRAIWPHVTSMWQRRVWLLALVVSFRPFTALAAWALPPLALAFYYSVLIAPDVAHLAPHLPDLTIVASKWFSAFATWVAQHWWIVLLPCVIPWVNLYTGRSVVLFNENSSNNGR